jgi:hypothetical protein
MKSGTRVRMTDVGGQQITGTVVGAGPTQQVQTMNPAESEAIETVVVRWDQPHLGTDTVAAAGLKVIDG